MRKILLLSVLLCLFSCESGKSEKERRIEELYHQIDEYNSCIRAAKDRLATRDPNAINENASIMAGGPITNQQMESLNINAWEEDIARCKNEIDRLRNE